MIGEQDLSQLTRAFPLIVASGALLASLAACDSRSEETSREQPLATSAKGAALVSNSHFGKQKVPCRDDQAMGRSLVELTSRDLGSDVSTRLIDVDSDEVMLRDGPGKIVVIVYSATTRDDADVITTTEHFLVNPSCQVINWSSATSIR